MEFSACHATYPNFGTILQRNVRAAPMDNILILPPKPVQVAQMIKYLTKMPTNACKKRSLLVL